jgi:hypothetical protein
MRVSPRDFLELWNLSGACLFSLPGRGRGTQPLRPKKMRMAPKFKSTGRMRVCKAVRSREWVIAAAANNNRLPGTMAGNEQGIEIPQIIMEMLRIKAYIRRN